QFLSFGHAGRDFDLVRFRFDRAPDVVTHIDRAHRAAQGLFERDQNVALNVTSALGEFLILKPRGAAKTTRATAHPRSKKLLKEITKARAAKMGFKFFTPGAAPAKSLAAREMFPA